MMVLVTFAFRAIICIDVVTTVTTIIIAVGSIGFIIKIAITNFSRGKIFTPLI